MFSCEFCENFKNIFFTEHLSWYFASCSDKMAQVTLLKGILYTYVTVLLNKSLALKKWVFFAIQMQDNCCLKLEYLSKFSISLAF